MSSGVAATESKSRTIFLSTAQHNKKKISQISKKQGNFQPYLYLTHTFDHDTSQDTQLAKHSPSCAEGFTD
jgi:hypothetical protein